MDRLEVMVVGNNSPLISSSGLMKCDEFIFKHAGINASIAAEVDQIKPQLIVVLGEGDANVNLISRIRQLGITIPLVYITDCNNSKNIVHAFRNGADDCLLAPVSKETALNCFLKNISSTKAKPVKWLTASGTSAPPAFVGRSQQINDIKSYIEKVACSDVNVLITGETGTGKERVAELVHYHSRRKKRRFISINCAAIPDTLFESELFGYEKGAFTGANAHNSGKLELADQGTIFFDEIGDMNLYSQSKILRAIETREVYPLGGKQPVTIDCKVISATNKNLESMIQNGTFRQDLYFRINVARIHVPSLRERKQDLPELLEYFIKILNNKFSTHVTGWQDSYMSLLMSYDWPGNIRELRNVIEVSYINRPKDLLDISQLPDWSVKVLSGNSLKPEQHEKDRIISTLTTCKWNKTKTAKKLNFSRWTLYRKLKRYQIY